MSTSTWTGAVNSDWADADNWSPAGVPGASSDVTIATGDAVASASIGTVNSITDSSDLSFESAGTNTVAAFLDNTGHLHVDANGGEGRTILNIGTTLTNSGDLVIGNATLSAPDEVTAASLDNTGRIYLMGSSANQALLDVAGSAGFGTAGILSGYARLAGESAIEFESGEITSLAAGSHLGLVGSDAFIEDSTATGSNSALTGLASIGLGALFALHDGAKVSTTGALANDGQVYLDTVGGDGGSSLTLAGALTNEGYESSLSIGNAALSASDKVTAASLDNTGSIHLRGSSANQALLDVTGGAGFGAAGVLSGNVTLAGDSAIEFKSGQITSLAGPAQLHLNGSDAFIEDSTALGSNSALTGLASIGAGATFELENKAAVSTIGSLVNDGTVYLDTNARGGGSSLTVAGALTNSGSLKIGNAAPYASLSASDEVTATSLDNTGQIELVRSESHQYQALLDVTAGSAGFGVAGTLTGSVGLFQDSAIEFLSGQITSLTGSLALYGTDAFIEDSTALGSNSALTGLASIGAGATFDLFAGASLSTTGSLVNNGDFQLGSSTLTVSGALTNTAELGISSNVTVTAKSLVNSGTVDLYAYGGTSSFGSTLSIAGALTNNGAINLFSDATGYSALSIGGALTNTGRLDIYQGGSVTANSFVNTETVDLTGSGTNLAVLNVSGTLTNNGSISIASDNTEELAGAVGGTGSFSLSASNLQFDSSVSPGQTITETGADALTLKLAQDFLGTISNFGTGDTIDATNFVAPPATTFNFVENSAMTGGTLTLTDTSLSLTANILMTGDYSNKSFTLAPDSGTGTLVKFA